MNELPLEVSELCIGLWPADEAPPEYRDALPECTVWVAYVPSELLDEIVAFLFLRWNDWGCAVQKTSIDGGTLFHSCSAVMTHQAASSSQ